MALLAIICKVSYAVVIAPIGNRIGRPLTRSQDAVDFKILRNSQSLVTKTLQSQSIANLQSIKRISGRATRDRCVILHHGICHTLCPPGKLERRVKPTELSTDKIV